jgi:pilus assembly protein CpaB
MGRRLIVVMLIAALIAGGVFYFARMVQQSRPAPQAQTAVSQPVASAPTSTTQVLVATKDMPAGTLIQANSLVFRAWPAAGIDDASHVVEGKGTLEEFQGAVLRAGIRSGEPALRGNMIKRGESGFLAAVLKPGMRAVTVSVNENTGVSGFIFPGDMVDLVLSHVVNLSDSAGTMRPHNVSETVMHDLRVIAVDQRASDQEQVPVVARGVTLEATPEQAERLALIQRMGEVRLVLRPLTKQDQGDGEKAPSAEVVATPLVPGAEAADARTFTLDSDLSQIIAPPGGTSSSSSGGGSIQVVRGQSSQEAQAK